jgi:hypothetical protein
MLLIAKMLGYLRLFTALWLASDPWENPLLSLSFNQSRFCGREPSNSWALQSPTSDMAHEVDQQGAGF